MLDAGALDEGIVHPVVGGIAEIELDEAAGHPVPPQQPEAFFRIAQDHRDHRGGGEHPYVQHGLAEIAGHVAVGDGGHEVPSHVAVEDIEAVHAEQQRDEGREQRDGLTAVVGVLEITDEPDRQAPALFIDGNAQHRCSRRGCYAGRVKSGS